MSDVIGTPSVMCTSERIDSPASRPGPRKLLMLDRFALSKLALKMSGMPRRSVIVLMPSAIRIVCSCDSITHGPAISASGQPGPMERFPTVTTCGFESLLMSTILLRDVRGWYKDVDRGWKNVDFEGK